MDLTAKKFEVVFEMARAMLSFDSDDRLTFTIIEKDGNAWNESETVNIKTVELRPQLLLITWKEKSGTTVTQVHDYEHETIYSNWTTPGGDFSNRKGTLKQV